MEYKIKLFFFYSSYMCNVSELLGVINAAFKARCKINAYKMEELLPFKITRSYILMDSFMLFLYYGRKTNKESPGP